MSGYLEEWWQHEITVEPYLGHGSRGPTYGAAFTFLGAVDDRRKLVRGASGQEAVSESRVFGPLSVGPVPPESRVRLPAPFGPEGQGRTTTVMAVAKHTSGGLDTPDHTELVLA